MTSWGSTYQLCDSAGVVVIGLGELWDSSLFERWCLDEASDTHHGRETDMVLVFGHGDERFESDRRMGVGER